jgi:hypothetical protein
MVQISWSGMLMARKLGKWGMLIPFLITQNNCCGAPALQAPAAHYEHVAITAS